MVLRLKSVYLYLNKKKGMYMFNKKKSIFKLVSLCTLNLLFLPNIINLHILFYFLFLLTSLWFVYSAVRNVVENYQSVIYLIERVRFFFLKKKIGLFFILFTIPLLI